MSAAVLGLLGHMQHAAPSRSSAVGALELTARCRERVHLPIMAVQTNIIELDRNSLASMPDTKMMEDSDSQHCAALALAQTTVMISPS